jgi:hypothetical protein
MFVRSFIEIATPFEELEAAFLDAPETWIPSIAREADDRGEELLVEVGFESAGVRMDRQVEISVGSPVRFPSQTVVPIAWKPISGERLLPALEGDLEIAPFTPRRSHLSISARYVPPFRGFGRALDRALLHRVAEATVKDFLDRVAAKLLTAPALIA